MYHAFHLILFNNNTSFLEGSLRPRNTVFNQTRFCYELVLDDTSVVLRCREDGTDEEAIPALKAQFSRIGRLLQVQPNSVVDVLAVVKMASPSKEIVTRVRTRSFIHFLIHLFFYMFIHCPVLLRAVSTFIRKYTRYCQPKPRPTLGDVSL